MANLTIGTAGHVDHGKSALVEVLTGTHPDRLQEEQDRGMTIELGFSFMTLANGHDIPIIDVPGHERFLKTMVAGVSGIHMVLFVVAADEGVMPQTIEHLGTVQLMGVEHGLIVLTKCDLADEEWLMLVEDEVRELVRDTFLEEATIHHVSSLTGEGVEALKTGIEASLSSITPGTDDGIFRLPIDRAFSLKGFGTIVAGTVSSGSVSLDDPLELLPSGVPVRLRGMQTHNQKVDRAEAGQRAALNLSNIKVQQVDRGDELSVPGYLAPTMMLDARVQVLRSLNEPLANRTRIRLHKGTAEVIGRIVILDQEELEPGAEGFIQFRLESPIVAERYERFIIRGFSSMRLLGGGRFLDVYPQKHRRFRQSVLLHLTAITDANPSTLIQQVLHDAYGEQRVRTIQELTHVTNLPADVVQKQVDRLVEEGTFLRFVNGAVIHCDWYHRLRNEILGHLETLHREQRLKEMVPRESIRARLASPINDVVHDVILKDLINENKIVQIGHSIKLPSHEVKLTAAEEKIRDTMVQTGTADGISVLSINDILHAAPDAKPDQVRAVATYLFDQGALVEFTNRHVMHRESLEAAKHKLIAYLQAHETVRAAEFREHLNISRAHATALLDYFCDQGVTHREAGTHTLAETNEGASG